MSNAAPPLVAVDRLTVAFDDRRLPVEVVRDVSFTLAPGGTLGIVGESGSGKSMTARALIGLLPESARLSGSLAFDGRDLVSARERDWEGLRGRQIGMVFQEPMTALNPAHRVGDQIAEGLVLHGLMDRRSARAEALRLIERVGIARARERIGAFPHELSGGQRQRVMIAMALACKPSLLIADEPTSALDVTIQAQIVELIAELKAEYGLALIVISHDLGVIADLAERTLVLYGGRVMEEGETAALFRAPAHPYTRGLLAARPGRHKPKGEHLDAIPGNVPSAADFPPGCPFFGRCGDGTERCRLEVPPPVTVGDTIARCWFPRARPPRGLP
ncbi:MAG: ABC transporter ATP-binding protein [Ancalomicrobiaceae bacterium]|nr:ABC transporter ATP-binding protein [Ancalomicrobiaceae bacterium]